MRSLFYLSMSSVTEFHFHFLIGQLQHRQFGPRGVLRSFDSCLTLFNIFPFPRCSFPTTSFWSTLRVLRSLDSGLTHSTFFYLLRRSLPTTSFGPHGHCVCGNFDTIRHFIISSVQLRQSQFVPHGVVLCVRAVATILTQDDFVSRVFASHFWARWRILRFFIPAWAKQFGFRHFFHFYSSSDHIECCPETLFHWNMFSFLRRPVPTSSILVHLKMNTTVIGIPRHFVFGSILWRLVCWFSGSGRHESRHHFLLEFLCVSIRPATCREVRLVRKFPEYLGFRKCPPVAFHPS